MPRDINGNFTLVAGNPVAPGTIIEADWANTTLNDIAAALTGSLSRSGSGGMLVPFKNADGTLLNPGITWVNAPNSGIYRNSTRMGFVWQGVEHFGMAGNAVGANVPFWFADGTLAAPGIAYLGDATSGMYKDATHIGFVWQGAEKASLSAAGFSLSTPSTFPNGTESLPGIAWTSDNTTGWFNDGLEVGFSWAGVAIAAYNQFGLGIRNGTQFGAGLNVMNKPSYSFVNALTTGINYDGSKVSLVWNGVEQAYWNGSGFVGGGGGGGTFADGSAAAPGAAFTSQLSTGMFRTGSYLGFSWAGSEFAHINGSGLQTTTLTATTAVSSPTVAGTTSMSTPTLTASGSVEAARLNVTAAAIPANGMYLSAANTPALSSAGSATIKWNSTGEVSMGKGANPFPGAGLNVSGPAAGAAITWGMGSGQQIQPSVTNTYVGVSTNPSTAGGAWNLPFLYQFTASFAGKGAGNTIGKMVGFHVDNTVVGAATVAGFESAIPDGAGRIGFYESGGCDSSFAGGLQIAAGFGVPAGGSAKNSIRIGATAGLGLYFGAGVPTVAAADGSVYFSTTATGTADTMWTRRASVWVNIF